MNSEEGDPVSITTERHVVVKKLVQPALDTGDGLMLEAETPGGVQGAPAFLAAIQKALAEI